MTPELESLKARMKPGKIYPVYKKFNADTVTPVSAYLSLTDGGEKPGFLLESVEKGDQLARYSFLGVDPRGKISSKNGELDLPDFLEVEANEDPYEAVQEIMADWDYVGASELPGFTGGLVGYFGYETIEHVEPTVPVKEPTSELFFPDCLLYYVENLLIFDHVERLVYLVGHVRSGEDHELEAQYRRVDKQLEKWRKKLSEQPPAPEIVSGSTAVSRRLSSNFAREDYLEAVEKVKSYVEAGDAFQVVISQRFELKDPNHPFNVYRRLRSLNPSPYMIYFDFEDFQLVGASPEMLVQKEDELVRTRPIAGTRRRGENSREDNRLARELGSDEKELAEHTMLVDLGRNDLGRVCKPGTVEVTEQAEIERYSHVMHLVSTVAGKIADDCDAVDVLRATFPAGTVSGAPKIRAMQIIDECEPQRRGPYSGAAGYFSFAGDLNSCIIIRTLINSGDKIYLQAGGGIVADSRPEREYEETREKARALVRALESLPEVQFLQ